MIAPSRKLPLAVLGATGLVGQRMVELLAGHPWFDLVELAASGRSAGRRYAEAVDWKLPGSIPAPFADLHVRSATPEAVTAPVVLSALDANVAGEVEDAFADAGRAVISNARNHRMDDDVPLVTPEVNADHLELIHDQRRRRGGPGFIVTNPNCSVIALTLALGPLHRAAGVRRVVVTTLQAASGAGYPGVPALDLLDNVIPFIGGEEDKIVAEPAKILGVRDGGRIRSADIAVSAQVHRVFVLDGHMLSVSVELDRPLEPEAARRVFDEFRGAPQDERCPSAPARPVVVVDGRDRPQPRLDRMAGDGMAIVIGQLRRCPALGLRFEVLGHNTIRGAAGGALLIAELLAARGWTPCSS